MPCEVIGNGVRPPCSRLRMPMGRLSLKLPVLLILLGTPALAQTTGRLNGTVLDPTGARIVGARIVLASSSTQEQKTSESDNSGAFSFLLVQPGDYKLTATAAGFLQKTVEDVTVRVTETTTVQISLGIAGVQESVTVMDRPALLQTDGPQLGRVVDARGVSQLPLSTRNFTQLLSLSPGTATYLPDSSGVGRNTQAISVNGARVTQ